MSAQDWFRCTRWSPEDQSQFFLHLKRSRGVFHKAQYLLIQAHTLQHDASPSLHNAALELLDLLIEEYPDPSQLAMAYHQKAQSLEATGRIKDATQAFFDSFSAEKAYPWAKTNAPIDFALFVLHHELRNLYDFALNGLKSPDLIIPFPNHQYQANMALAIILSEKGEREEARLYAAKALAAVEKTHSGFRYHPTIGLVNRTDDRLHHKLEKIVGG